MTNNHIDTCSERHLNISKHISKIQSACNRSYHRIFVTSNEKKSTSLFSLYYDNCVCLCVFREVEKYKTLFTLFNAFIRLPPKNAPSLFHLLLFCRLNNTMTFSSFYLLALFCLFVKNIVENDPFFFLQWLFHRLYVLYTNIQVM